MAGILDRRKVIQWVLAASLVLGAPLAAPKAWSEEKNGPSQLAALPSTGRFDYDVIRDGERIGAHSVIFRREGRHLAIATQTDIAVGVLGITLFRFHYKAEEEWMDGRLTRLVSRTDNDGEILAANLAKANGRIQGTCNGLFLDLPADLLPISVWHPDFMRQSVVFDQYWCVTRKVRATEHGIEPVPVAAGQKNLQARHYAVTGELQRDVWYGPDGQTVQVLLPVKDGSEIAFLLRAR